MKQVTSSELREWITAGKDFLLIDIREEVEREAFHIGGAHIPMGELMSHLKEMPTDKDIVLYCEKGIRSVIAIQRLEAMGFNNLFNLSGGMSAWKQK